ncbi:hypothetical protein ACH4OX_36130 [Streptomyces roseolus]|uniref:hypothetical protein n=1 Tax=Streptomyces roseolus TaxID=67358 RepID=UPI0037A1BF0D
MSRRLPPAGTGTQIPSDQLLPRTAPSSTPTPTITAADVSETLGTHPSTATRALNQLRAARIADLMTADPDLTVEQATANLGYPVGQARTVVRRQALTELRARTARTYLADVAQALHTAGLAPDPAPAIEQTRYDTLRASILLAPDAPAPVVVWEENSGWRTAPRRHPYTAPGTHPSSPVLLSPPPTPSSQPSPPDHTDRRAAFAVSHCPRCARRTPPHHLG